LSASPTMTSDYVTTTVTLDSSSVMVSINRGGSLSSLGTGWKPVPRLDRESPHWKNTDDVT
jgi:hypothetical protein